MILDPSGMYFGVSGHISFSTILQTERIWMPVVAGAPACPCSPGAQRLPQQARSPGSKYDMPQAPVLRQGGLHGFEKLQWNIDAIYFENAICPDAM